jgi:hypothetical protein
MRRETVKLRLFVIASEAKQSIAPRKERMDCFASLAMTEGMAHSRDPLARHDVGETNPDLIAPQLCGQYLGSKWPEIRWSCGFFTCPGLVFSYPIRFHCNSSARPPDSLS